MPLFQHYGGDDGPPRGLWLSPMVAVWLRIIVVCLAFLAVFVLFGIGIVYSHEGADPISTWYRSLRTANGGSCCSEADCQPVEARLMPDHWEVLNGSGPVPRWEIVPEEVVLTRDNPEGRAVLCRFAGRILCFVPGSGV